MVCLKLFLKKAADTLAPICYLIFTYVINTCKWPENWKCAFITPIFKKGSRADVENYRPISILPRVSIIMDKFLFIYIYDNVKDSLNTR